MEKKINVSRFTDTKVLRFTVEFVTPCFLGGADGNAELRVAPFKNLLRRWWRIANGKLSPEELWKKESRLFGSTEKDPDIIEFNRGKSKSEQKPESFGKSKVDLEIEQSNVHFSTELEKSELKKFLYLGYGPVQAKTSDTKKYIKADSSIEIKLTIPNNEINMMINVLTLINLFGTIGSRSRKGFGSILISPKPVNEEGGFNLCNLKRLREELPHLHEGIANLCEDRKNYPYYLACDEKGMCCWNTSQKSSYNEVLEDMTNIYKNIVVTVKKQSSGRTILGSATEIKNTEIKRIPSPLLMKVVKQGEKYSGRILHLAYNISGIFTHQTKVWNEVYIYLDSIGLKRFGGAVK